MIFWQKIGIYTKLPKSKKSERLYFITRGSKSLQIVITVILTLKGDTEHFDNLFGTGMEQINLSLQTGPNKQIPCMPSEIQSHRAKNKHKQ